MKALSYIALAFAAIFIAASCVVEDQLVTVEYNVSSVQTRSSDVVTANYVWYALYDLNGRLLKDYGIKPIIDGNANCPVSMIKGQSYRVVFVAQHYSLSPGGDMLSSYPISASQARLSMPAVAHANSDDYDLFRGIDTVIEYNGERPEKVILDRIVSQVNILADTDEWDVAKTAGLLPDSSELTLSGVPEAYDLLAGTVAGAEVTVNFEKSGLMGTDYLLGRVYSLASDDITVTVGLYDGYNKVNGVTVYNLDLEENRRINISGMSLTE